MQQTISRAIDRLKDISEITQEVMRTLPKLAVEVGRLRHELDMARSRADLPHDIVETFETAKSRPEYRHPYEQREPLISICVATYNRSSLLVDRSLRSLVRQSYKNLEIIVVGDCCTDDTEQRVAAMRDSRIVFKNLAHRGVYPANPMWRWMVAGTAPVNQALKQASGAFITHLDDDDEHAPDRVEKLVRFMKQTEADLIYHPFKWEVRPDAWRTNKANGFRYSQVSTSSIFYHNWLKRIPWDLDAYKYREPGDWNRLRKIQYIGAKLVRYPEPLLKHYKERLQHTR